MERNTKTRIEIVVKTKTQKCKDCKKEFEFKSTARYARKYCDKCSKKRKEDYENLYLVKAGDCDED